MSKRARSSGSLTGGTGDVNPQIFLMSLDPGATYADTSFQLPIQRLPTQNRAQVMEILKVEWGLGAGAGLVMTAGANQFFSAYLTTRTFGTAEPNANQQDGSVISKWQWSAIFLAGTTNVGTWAPGVYVQDLTDGAGHGLLVATDSLFLGAIQTAGASPVSGLITCRVFYRFKNVGVLEYVGIVQSQQS